MKLPTDVGQLLRRRFDARHRDWLTNESEAREWPLDVALGIPGEQSALNQLDVVHAWVDAWRAWQGEGKGTLQWTERRWRVLGTQRVPGLLRLDSPRQVASWLAETGRWDRACNRYAALIGRWPVLRQRIGKLFDALADYSEPDFERLVAALIWLDAHPDSGLYLRQLPIPGLDTKWVEARKSVLSTLMCLLRGRQDEAADFYALCGLRRAPVQLRMRILDPDLRAHLGGLGDLTAPLGDLARLDLKPAHVLIVENLQTGLALGNLHDTVAFMGLGYSVDLLAQLPWVRKVDCVYWGDLDTHGFAILSRAREHLPALRTVLMDEPTLVVHQALWTTETVQHTAPTLPHLLPEEEALYRALKQGVFGPSVRLEQERLAWNRAWDSVVATLRA